MSAHLGKREDHHLRHVARDGVAASGRHHGVVCAARGGEGERRRRRIGPGGRNLRRARSDNRTCAEDGGRGIAILVARHRADAAVVGLVEEAIAASAGDR